MTGAGPDGGPGIQRDWRRASALNPEHQPMAIAAAYRRFLQEPGVENEFHAVQALAHRLQWAARERLRLRDEATAAEVEAGRLARAHDADRRGFSFGVGTAIAAGLAAIDTIPAFLAAQAFGLDLWTTVGITAVLVAALAAAMWVITHHQAGWPRWTAVGGLTAGLVAIGALRWWYLVVTVGDQTSAVLEAAELTIFTTLLVWFGVIVLGFTRPRRVSAAERRARSLRRQANRAGAAELDASKRAEVAMRELIGRAQVFSNKALDDPESRSRFVDHVRQEVERDGDGGADDRAGAPVDGQEPATGQFSGKD
jgi:hypothetical protein